MQFIDRTTDRARLPAKVGELIQGMLHNRQIFDEGQDDPPYTTQAIKYASAPQQRRQTSTYEGDDSFVTSIIDIFGFDPLDFQVECWQTVNRLDRERVRDDHKKAAVISAPTGFGKTEAFLGPIYKLLLDGRQEGAAIVYPSRALLQDQLGRILPHLHRINASHDESLSVGLYMGGQPWKMEEVETSKFFDRTQSRPRFKLTNCWCGSAEEPHALEFHGSSQTYEIRCEEDEGHCFSDSELILPRSEVIFSNQPDILLTTLESLESFAHKPHYPLIDVFDTIVLDEIHLNTQLRGAHAAKIIANVNDISDEPLLWLGSSATIDNPARFGRQIFGIEDETNIEALRPPESDFDRNHADTEHYYFLLAPEDGPGVSSMSIQQYMLLGHCLLEDDIGDRGKLLAFIDSISQVNQKNVQLVNADSDRQLWQYHADQEDDVEDWRALASSMGHQFIEEPLEIMRVFADEGFDSEIAARSDLLLSTSFLEVGIDVGEITIVTQYRTPWDLSSFLQRAGRAARQPGTDSHIVVFLSNLTNDANMFYRAEQFLDSSIRTPLNVDNPVVEWIHDRFNEYYRRSSDINANQNKYRSNIEEHKAFIQGYLAEDLGYGEAADLLLRPRTFFNDYFEGDIEVSQEPLLSTAMVVEIREVLETYHDEIREDFRDIEDYFGLDEGAVIRGTGAVDMFILEVQDEILSLVNSFRGQVSGFAKRLAENDIDDQDELRDSVRTELDSVHNAASTLPEGEPADKIAHFSDLLADLYGLTADLFRLRSAATRVSQSAVPQVNTRRLSEVTHAVDQLDSLGEDERLEKYYQRQRELFYLGRALDELYEYCDSNSKPYFSLYKVKHLLRCVYYIDRYLRICGESSTRKIWFVPPDYFGSSGQFMTVFEAGAERSGRQESIDKIVSTYTPYRSEYQSEAGTMQAFLPRTEVDGEDVRFSFEQYVTGEERDGILIPDSIRLTQITDLSKDQARNIVRYCPVCLQIITNDDQCLRHDESELGKIHAKSRVDTSIAGRSIEGSRGAISLAEVSAETTLQGVMLDITPAQWRGPEVGYALQSGEDRLQREVSSPEPPLGFKFDTRGLIIDLSEFQSNLSGEIREQVGLYKDFGEVDFDYQVYHTAAHFFVQLVADVSSVNSTNLFYGFDENEEEVYIFERTEGGQGIVDLVFDELRTDPASVLETINRIAYNPQVMNERLWAKKAFIEGLPNDPRSASDIKHTVNKHLQIPFDETTDLVVQEVLASIDRCRQFATDSNRELGTAFEIKHSIAVELVQGAGEFPRSAAEEAGVSTDELDRVKTLFFSPDIDGCVENLQLTECLTSGSQGESLSYVILEALRNWLTISVPTEDAAEAMFEYERPPAAEINGTSIFLNF
jgi:hypothetical protein